MNESNSLNFLVNLLGQTYGGLLDQKWASSQGFGDSWLIRLLRKAVWWKAQPCAQKNLVDMVVAGYLSC